MPRHGRAAYSKLIGQLLLRDQRVGSDDSENLFLALGQHLLGSTNRCYPGCCDPVPSSRVPPNEKRRRSMTNAEPAPTLRELIERSNRLGSDRRNTNYGGGNTSAKGVVADPVSAEEVDVMWVKGSGGDLATLTASGVSALRLDRVRALKDQYVDISQEDELHQLLDHCVFGPPGPAPSIDTSMHALLPAAHVDHLHPDSVIAIAASVDGEALTNEIFGDEIGWVPWQRPGFDLALKIEAMRAKSPSMRGVVMGGHGVSTWADTSDECERVSLDVIQRAAAFIEQRGKPEPLGPSARVRAAGADERRRRAARFAPILRGPGFHRSAGDRPLVRR